MLIIFYILGDDGPYTVTFPAGMTNASFNVIIIDNNKNQPEHNETICLIINSSVPSNIIVSDPAGQTTVIILDDDCK